MKIALITLHVKDLEQSITFYNQRLGLKIGNRMETPHGEIIFLGDEGATNLELIKTDDLQKIVYSGFSIGFDVASMEEALEWIKEDGYQVIQGPFSPTPHTTLLFFEGPNGECIELLERSNS